MNNVLSSELIGFGIQFLVDSMINFVRALLWPVYVIQLWPPAGLVALVAGLCRLHDTLFVADNTFLSPAWQLYCW